MRKSLVLLAILAMQVVPANAAEEKTFEQKHIEQTALIPVKIASFAFGSVIGTPIAIVRCEAKRMNTYTSSFAQEFERNDNWVTPTMAASVPGQALRAAGTVGEGILNGVGNALVHSIRDPFSEKVFSLKQLETLD